MRGMPASMMSSGDLSCASTVDEDSVGLSLRSLFKCDDVLDADEMGPCHCSPTKSRYQRAQRSCASLPVSPVRDDSCDLSAGECCNVLISPSEALARLNDMDAAIRASGLHRVRRSSRSELPAQGGCKGAQFTTDDSERLRTHTPRESSLRTLDTSLGASHSYGRSLRLALMTYQDVPVHEAPQGPKRLNSGQWRDQGIDPQAGKPKAVKPFQSQRRNSHQWQDQTIDPQAGKLQVVKRSSPSPATRRKSSTQTFMRRVSPQVMTRDREIDGLNSDQCQDQTINPQAGKLQAVKRSSPSPATRRKSSTQTFMRRVSPQVMTRDREIDGLTNVATAGRYLAVRDQVVPALLQAGLILLMTIAALGLLAGYVLVFKSFHAY